MRYGTVITKVGHYVTKSRGTTSFFILFPNLSTSVWLWVWNTVLRTSSSIHIAPSSRFVEERCFGAYSDFAPIPHQPPDWRTNILALVT